MKKTITALLCTLLLTSCGVGVYSVSSGRDGGAFLSVTDEVTAPVTVVVDGAEYKVQTVKTSKFKKNRRIKETSDNTVKVAAGQHDVQVLKNGQEVYTKKIFISDSEHRVIEL